MSLTAPNPIIKPFCNTGTQVAPPVGADSLVANQETGFPNSQATPLPIGTEVEQDQMNGVLKLYTSLLLWLNSGGQFTFNQAFSDANGGYAIDNILWCASNSTFQRSLVANNTANFVTTPSYINDGINWVTNTSPYFPDIQDNQTTGNVTIGGRIPSSNNIITGTTNTFTASSQNIIQSTNANTITGTTNTFTASSQNIIQSTNTNTIYAPTNNITSTVSNKISTSAGGITTSTDLTQLGIITKVQEATGKISVLSIYTGAKLGNILEITEADGTTPNTGLGMNYGDRVSLSGNYLSLVSGPSSIASLADINNRIQHKTATPGVGGSLVMSATFNGINWSGTIHGEISMGIDPNPAVVSQVLQLDALLGIDGLSAVFGNLSFVAGNTSFNISPSVAYVAAGANPNEIVLMLYFSSSVAGNNFVGYFSASFNATSIT